MQPIGILGGTFDPVHYGHLHPADEVRRALDLAEVRLIPAGTPPHRATPNVAATHRLCMVELAVREFPKLVADGRELDRPGPSYTVDTLKSIRDEIGNGSLCLLVGADVFLQIETWHAWRQLPELAHLVVLRRPDVAVDNWPDWAEARRCDDPSALAAQPSGFVHFAAITPVDISATRIRDRLRRGEPIDAQVPAPVIEYIHSHQLYKG